MSYMETTMFCHGFTSVVSWLLRLFHSKSLWTSANSHIMHHILNIKEDERNLTTQRGIKCSMVSGVYRKIFLWIGLWYLKIHDLWQLAWPREEKCMRVRPAVTEKIFIEQGCLWSYKSRERFLRMHWVSTASSPASLPITILTLLCPNRQRRERSDWGTDTASIVSIFHGYKVQKFLLGARQTKEDVWIRKDCQIFFCLASSWHTLQKQGMP